MATHATKSEWSLVTKIGPGRSLGSVAEDDGRVLISKHGRVQLKRAIVNFLGNTTNVQLFVNKKKGSIGIKSCAAGAPQSFAVSTTGKGGTSGHNVSAISAVMVINPNWKQYSDRYPYTLDNTRQMVIVDLSAINA